MAKINERTLPKLAPPPGKDRLVAWDDELAGFGVVVGARGASFVAQGRLRGTKRRYTIGKREHGWTVKDARVRAREILAQLAQGVDPKRPSPAAGGPTLRDALRRHVSNMRKRGRSARSIETLQGEVTRLMGE